MSAFTAATTILRSFLTTSWAFGPESVRIKLCGLVTIRVPYSEIRDCTLRPFHNRLRMGSASDEWHDLRAGILRTGGRVYVLTCENAEGFIAALRNHAPQIQVRQLGKKTRSWEWPAA